MGEELNAILEEFTAHLKKEFEEAGLDTSQNWDELRIYAAERAAFLSTIVGQPGFELAVRAERDAVALRAGMSAVDLADAAGQRWLGIVQGTLLVVAKVLALGLA